MNKLTVFITAFSLLVIMGVASAEDQVILGIFPKTINNLVIYNFSTISTVDSLANVSGKWLNGSEGICIGTTCYTAIPNTDNIITQANLNYSAITTNANNNYTRINNNAVGNYSAFATTVQLDANVSALVTAMNANFTALLTAANLNYTKINDNAVANYTNLSAWTVTNINTTMKDYVDRIISLTVNSTNTSYALNTTLATMAWNQTNSSYVNHTMLFYNISNQSLWTINTNNSLYAVLASWPMNSTNTSYALNATLATMCWNSTNTSYALNTTLAMVSWNSTNTSYALNTTLATMAWNTTNTSYALEANAIANYSLLTKETNFRGNLTWVNATNVSTVWANVSANITMGQNGTITMNYYQTARMYWNKTCMIIAGPSSEVAIC